MVPNRGPDAGVAHLVERHLAKVEVASSSLVTRSKQIRNAHRVPYFIRYRGQVVRQESAKLSFTRSNRVGTSKQKGHPIGCPFCLEKSDRPDLKD